MARGLNIYDAKSIWNDDQINNRRRDIREPDSVNTHRPRVLR